MKLLRLAIAVLILFLPIFFAPSCVEPDPCNCQNNRICDGDGNCNCPTGYIGTNCETYVGSGGNTNSCPITQSPLSETKIRSALQSFTFDGTKITTISEANKMLQFICSPIDLHTSNSGYTCGRFSNGWHITIWINTYGKADTYGIRYNQSDGHTHFSSNNTYFEISKNNSGGNGACNSTSYYGTQNCSSGYVAVSSNSCCPSSSPYLGVQTGYCYATCDAAKNGGNTTIVFGTGQTGGTGGNCVSTPYYGPQICSSGYVAVSSTSCCPSSNPYLGVQTGNCYTTCDAAKNAGNTSIVFGTGQTDGTGGNCVSTPYYGAQNCNSGSGYVAVSSSTCCPSSSPYLGVQTNKCYSTCDAAKSAGNTSISFGTGQTNGGGNGNCNWDAANCVQITEISGASCADPQSLDLKIKNICNEKLRVYVCFQNLDGSWPIIGTDDGTLQGLPPGYDFQVFRCKKVAYHVWAIPYTTFSANNCNYPSCN